MRADSSRNRISLRISSSSALRTELFVAAPSAPEPRPARMSTASDSSTTSTSFRLFATRVPPDDTMSKMASAMPAAGAISTEPVMTSIVALTPFESRYFFRMFGYEVAILRPSKYSGPLYCSPFGMASESLQAPKPSRSTISMSKPFSTTSLSPTMPSPAEPAATTPGMSSSLR